MTRIIRIEKCAECPWAERTDHPAYLRCRLNNGAVLADQPGVDEMCPLERAPEQKEEA